MAAKRAPAKKAAPKKASAKKAAPTVVKPKKKAKGDHLFKKGDPRINRTGRPKGSPNKTTVDVKAAILSAFRKVGGEDYLVGVAAEQPQVFCALLGRVLPTEISATLKADSVFAKALTDAMASRKQITTSSEKPMKVIEGTAKEVPADG